MNVDYNSYSNVDDHPSPTFTGAFSGLRGGFLKTVQITLDEDLAEAVDRAVETLGTTRSGFTREALRDALAKLQRLAREERHRAGYEKHPVETGEFDGWDDEQVWAD